VEATEAKYYKDSFQKAASANAMTSFLRRSAVYKSSSPNYLSSSLQLTLCITKKTRSSMRCLLHQKSNYTPNMTSAFLPLHQKMDFTTHHVLRTLRDFIKPQSRRRCIERRIHQLHEELKCSNCLHMLSKMRPPFHMAERWPGSVYIYLPRLLESSSFTSFPKAAN
jgi:hypothetical protein